MSRSRSKQRIKNKSNKKYKNKKYKNNKFGLSVEQGTCCKEIDKLVRDINNQLNNLFNMRKGLYPDDSPEMMIFYKKIEDMRDLINNTDIKDLIKGSEKDITQKLSFIHSELKKPNPNYGIIYTHIVNSGKDLSGEDVSDLFTNNQRNESVDKNIAIEKLRKVYKSENKLDALLDLYKYLFISDLMPGM